MQAKGYSSLVLNLTQLEIEGHCPIPLQQSVCFMNIHDRVNIASPLLMLLILLLDSHGRICMKNNLIDDIN